MQSQEFVAVYERDPASTNRYSGELGKAMEPAIQWSRVFGHILHDRLSNPKGLTLPSYDQAAYANWLYDELPSLQSYVNSEDTPDKLRADSELNFHRLNGPMTPQWNIILNGRWRPPAPVRKLPRLSQNGSIRAAQDNLAVVALEKYHIREMTAGPKAKFAYFSDENSERRKVVEGSLNEYDAGIVLLGMLFSRPELTVVPAPMQFEHSRKHANNADFIVYHASGQAIGVQVKGSLLQSEAAVDYDPSRIALVDARIDFGNELAKRIYPNRSLIEHVPWAGLICANQVHQMRPDSYLAQLLIQQGHFTRTRILSMKIQARQITDPVKPLTQEAIKRVSERILPRVLPEHNN